MESELGCKSPLQLTNYYGEFTMSKEIIGNLTTIIKILIMTVAPFIAVYIGTDEQTVIAFLTAILTFGLAVIDAKYPNTFGSTEPEQKEEIFDNDAPVLNDEYEFSGDDEDGC
jgi:hypothetical protein